MTLSSHYIHFLWYKHGLIYDTGLFILYTLARYFATLVVGTIVCVTLNAIFNIRTDLGVIITMGLLGIYYAVELITVIISCQYDVYCEELDRTINTLKGTQDV